jgi:hypothetical protein
MRKTATLFLGPTLLLLLTAQAPVPQVSAPAEAEKAAAKVFQVNVDLLSPDVSAQPETQAEPSVAVDPEREGHLVAVYQEGRNTDGGSAAIGYAVSLDRGKHWSSGLLPGLTLATGGPYKRASDPWVAFGPGNRVYCAAIGYNETTSETGVFVSTSRDGGRTWDAPVAVHTQTGHLDDKCTVVVDTVANSPYRGRIYVGWDSSRGSSRDLQVSWSSDEGRSFSTPAILDKGFNGDIVPLVGPKGAVYATWLVNSNDNFSAWIARSSDGGVTWSAPVRISDVSSFFSPDIRDGAINPVSAIDPRTGQIYVAWEDERFSPGVNKIVLTRSRDGGQTWTPLKVVSDGPANAQNFTPAIAVTGNGRVGIAYSSTRNDPHRHYLVDEYIAISKNQGQTFGASQRLSPASWDIRFAADAGSFFFLGDYQGLAAGKKTFYPVWVATPNPSRLNPATRQPDVFSTRVPAR